MYGCKGLHGRHRFGPGYAGADRHYGRLCKIFIAWLWGVSGGNGFHIYPFFDRLKSSPLFLNATKGIMASFVGLLLFVSIKFALAVPWDIIRVLL